MDYQVKLPHVGESVVEAVIGEWLVKPGQSVEKYDPLVEIVTDKVAMELPSPAAGTITKILASPGETVSMGAPIAEMDADEVPQEEVSPGPAEVPEDDSVQPDRIGTLVQGVNMVSLGTMFTDESAPEAGESRNRRTARGTSPNPDGHFTGRGQVGVRARDRPLPGKRDRPPRPHHQEGRVERRAGGRREDGVIE